MPVVGAEFGRVSYVETNRLGTRSWRLGVWVWLDTAPRAAGEEETLRAPRARPPSRAALSLGPGCLTSGWPGCHRGRRGHAVALAGAAGSGRPRAKPACHRLVLSGVANGGGEMIDSRHSEGTVQQNSPSSRSPELRRRNRAASDVFVLGLAVADATTEGPDPAASVRAGAIGGCVPPVAVPGRRDE